MGKRKQTAPQHADQAKRQQLQWNMADQLGSSGSQSFICDSTLKNENLIPTENGTDSVPSSATAAGESSSGSSTPIHALCVDAFYQNLASCHSTLTLHSPYSRKDPDRTQHYEFGSFKITLAAHPKLTPLPDQLPEFKECWLYLADSDNPSMLYFETEDNNENVAQQKKPKSRQSKFGVFWFVTLSAPVAVLTSLKSKMFLLLCSEFDTHRKDFHVKIYGSEGIIMRLSHPSEAVRIKMPQVAIQRLMEYYYDISLPYNFEGRERTTGHDFFHLYECVMSIQHGRLSSDELWLCEVANIQHDCLKPVLRQYQKQSVAWMLRQEKQNSSNSQEEELHPLYCEVTLRDGTRLYYNRHAGSLINDRPKVIPTLPGGILADEMGLGKTVEVLCCMLLHPRLNMELPEELPTLDDSLSESNENSQSTIIDDAINSNSEVFGDDLTKTTYNSSQPVCEGRGEKELTDRNDSTNSISPKCEVDGNLGDANGNPVDKGVDVISGKVEIPDARAAAISLNMHSVEDRNPLLSDSGKAPEEDIKLSSSDPQSVSVPSPPRFEVMQDEITFLSSKTSDLTDDSVEETADSSTPSSYIGSNPLCQTLQISDSLAPDTIGPSQVKKSKLSAGNNELKPSSNKVIIKINANKEASITVEQVHSASLAPHSSVTSANFVTATSAQPQGMSLSTPSSLMLSPQSSSNIGQVRTGQEEKKKSKRKSKGYIEYVPITNEESNYFSTKPAARKQFFECNCGQLDDEEETRKKGLHTVKCNVCGMSQHAECMNYDLKDPFRGEYKCPHCHALSTTIKSGATLIISPYSICHQWIEEISKHIKERSIKVFIYTGVSKLGYIQPQTLAQQDIVITTYDVLRKEVDYVNLPHTNSESGRRFRHPKRFLATPSPMVAVEWWRICLDEAQMVECVTTKTAEMALKLKAVNRWCVTGTPLMRSVEDIYGLLLFLGVDPLLVQQWFRMLVWEPFCYGFSAPMHHALSQVLWRTAKKDVIDQIALPGQTEEVNWLTFSPVEEHFYRRQHEVYLRNAYALRRKVGAGQDPNTKLHTLDRKTMNELLSPLFRLRQACCHPQIVRGEFLPLNKAMMTMEELLEHMTKKVKTECEEAHRQIVASLNGMAGLAILRGKLADAVEKYRDVLRSVEEHKNQFRTDDLQQLHAMNNLAEVLDKKPTGVSPTLRDANLREQCEDLKTKYMSRTKTSVTASQESLDLTQAAIKDLNRKLSALDGDWWADVVDMTVQRGIDADLIHKIKDDLVRTSTTEGTIADIFTSADGLMYVIDSHLQALTKARSSLTTALSSLAKDTSEELVQQAATCCLRPVEEILKSCQFCKVDELFNEYESKLFLFVERGVTVTGDDINLAYQVSTKRQGTWADSEVERGLKSILAFYRLHFEGDHDILEAAGLQIKYLDCLKKEFKNLRSLWLSHREMISAIDELAMATERLRLREEFEPKAATKILNVIEEREMLQHDLKCSSDEIVGRDDLRKKLGQLVYLTNLAKKNHEGEGANPDVCPICQSELGVEWSVLMCGHCFCLRCIRTMIDRNLIGGHLIDRRLKCPMCRFMTPVREISYVTTKRTEKVDVKGSHSTKVQAIIECLIKIRQQDPTAKSLVFSVWVSVLDILGAGLAENKIPYKSLHDPNYFQKNLTAFRSEESIQVLLLPLHTGANGLNLVEANHVLLVEPELNLEEEAQAVSRIYRIGQTRQTKIHRFLVRGTIEEKIFHMVKTLRDTKSGESKDDESVELTVGHITSLLQQPGPDEEEETENNIRRGESGENVSDGARVAGDGADSGGPVSGGGDNVSRDDVSGVGYNDHNTSENYTGDVTGHASASNSSGATAVSVTSREDNVAGGGSDGNITGHVSGGGGSGHVGGSSDSITRHGSGQVSNNSADVTSVSTVMGSDSVAGSCVSAEQASVIADCSGPANHGNSEQAYVNETGHLDTEDEAAATDAGLSSSAGTIAQDGGGGSDTIIGEATDISFNSNADPAESGGNSVQGNDEAAQNVGEDAATVSTSSENTLFSSVNNRKDDAVANNKVVCGINAVNVGCEGGSSYSVDPAVNRLVHEVGLTAVAPLESSLIGNDEQSPLVSNPVQSVNSGSQINTAATGVNESGDFRERNDTASGASNTTSSGVMRGDGFVSGQLTSEYGISSKDAGDGEGHSSSVKENSSVPVFGENGVSCGQMNQVNVDAMPFESNMALVSNPSTDIEPWESTSNVNVSESLGNNSGVEDSTSMINTDAVSRGDTVVVDTANVAVPFVSNMILVSSPRADVEAWESSSNVNVSDSLGNSSAVEDSTSVIGTDGVSRGNVTGFVDTANISFPDTGVDGSMG